MIERYDGQHQYKVADREEDIPNKDILKSKSLIIVPLRCHPPAEVKQNLEVL